MKAMILAAGRGERMRPLTDTCPKPLLKVNGIPLIEYHIRNLAAAGIKDIVINIAWLGEKLLDYLGKGEKFAVNIRYSEEPVALETAGGIIKALPLLAEQDDEVFIVVNGDIYCDYDFSQLPALLPKYNAHLLLIENPEHNLKGDFKIDSGNLVNLNSLAEKTYTYSGIALYRKSFFKQYSLTLNEDASTSQNIQPLAPMLRAGADARTISASLMDSSWTDVGTPERLAKLNRD